MSIRDVGSTALLPSKFYRLYYILVPYIPHASLLEILAQYI